MLLVDMAAAGTARAQPGLRDSGYASRFKRSGLSERRDKARVASYLVCVPHLLGVALYRVSDAMSSLSLRTSANAESTT